MRIDKGFGTIVVGLGGGTLSVTRFTDTDDDPPGGRDGPEKSSQDTSSLVW